MIIQCIKCNKTFEVNASLIPNNGRKLQCGSCNYTWFYKPHNNEEVAQNENINFENLNEDNSSNNADPIKENQFNHNQVKMIIEEEIPNKEELIENNKIIKSSMIKKSNNLTLGSFLSFILIAIISFVALIIVLDTFKSPLSSFFPGLELLLYNLFESIKDVFLFVKNLFF